MKKILLPLAFMMLICVAACDETDEDFDDQNDNQEQENSSSTTTSDYKFFTQEQIEMANTAKDCDYLDQEEKNVIFYSNLARIDGEAFYKEFLSNIGKTEYEKSLIEDLKKTKNQTILMPNEDLCNAAQSHCDDMHDNKFFDHYSSDGTDPFARIKKFYKGFACAENIACGYSDGKSTVIQWLIDEGTPSLGHRKSILNDKTYAQSSKVGVGRAQHNQYGYCWTMDFAE